MPARSRLLLAIALGSAAVAIVADSTGALARLELNSVDLRFKIRGKRSPRRDVVIVAMDSRSVGALRSQLGLSVAKFNFVSRADYARGIDQIHRGQPKLIAVDIQFVGRKSAAADAALIGAIARSQPVVLGTLETPAGVLPVPAGVSDPSRIGAVPASVGLQPDSDGKVRRMLYAPVTLPTLAVKAAELVLGRPIRQDQFPNNAAWIAYRGPAGTLTTYSFFDVMTGHIPPATFKGKVVVLGITDPLAQRDDFKTPFSTMPGVEVHASALSTILDGLPLKPVRSPIDLILVLALAAGPALLAMRLPGSMVLLGSAAGLGIFAVGTQLAFNGGELITATAPLLALIVSTGAAATVNFVSESRARRNLQQAIDRLLARLSAGDSLAGYEIEDVAGRGGMGVVYRARQPALDRLVALKVIAPEHSTEELFRTRFKREALLAASIDHPNVIPVFEAGESQDLLFLAMRYVEGPDLGTILARKGRLEPRRATALITQVAAALAAAHHRGLVHRDVKPGNILVSDEDGREHVYLTDFGLTKSVDSDTALTNEGLVVGTLDYLSPEQVQNQAIDSRADIYALGCVFYQLLTGRVPFPRDTDVSKMFAHVSSPVPLASALCPTLPAELDRVLERAMAKNPDQRYSSAAEFAADAAAAIACYQGPQSGREGSESGRVSTPSGRAG